MSLQEAELKQQKEKPLLEDSGSKDEYPRTGEAQPYPLTTRKCSTREFCDEQSFQNGGQGLLGSGRVMADSHIWFLETKEQVVCEDKVRGMGSSREI